MPLLMDVTPLLENAAYRRLWVGLMLAGIGSAASNVTIGLQVFDLTGSTASVGLVGLFAFVPVVGFGLYGGALADHHDRRTVALIAQIVIWVGSIAAALQAWLGNTEVVVLYAIVVVLNAGFAVLAPARAAIYPRLVPTHQLPAVNALHVLVMTGSLTIGPLIAGVLVDWWGFKGAYTADALLTVAAVVGVLGLPPFPPQRTSDRRVPGLSSVVEGFRFLALAPNVRMTFLVDIAAMVLAQPRVLLPAAGSVFLGGGARTVGLLYAASAVGGIVTMAFSGPLGRINAQGRAIVVTVLGWGVGVVGLGVALLLSPGGAGLWSSSAALVVAVVGLAFSGACDSVSAVFRTTILQSAAPDEMRGRLQGVFIVVVAGGPRLGDLLGGGVTILIGEAWTAIAGGLACVVVVVLLALWQRGFVRYDAREPTP